MAGLKLNHIYKVYENGTKAVSDFNMEIKDKEFIVFVGPSEFLIPIKLRWLLFIPWINTSPNPNNFPKKPI